MILEVICSSDELNLIMYIIKNILKAMMIISPIIVIISSTNLLFKMMSNPEEKKYRKQLLNTFMALIILFFIPLFVNLAMKMAGDKTDFSACYNNAKRIKNNNGFIQIEEENNYLDSNENITNNSSTTGKLDFSCKSSNIKSNFSCDTMKIVENHLNDFNANSFKKVMKEKGGFHNYVNSLGGVFSNFYGKNLKITTETELQQVSEYVFGFMYMYGFDYYNNSWGKYCKWGGNCVTIEKYKKGTLPSPGSSDAFYPGTTVHNQEDSNYKNAPYFDKVISGEKGLNMTTSCDITTDFIYYKAGIFNTKSNALRSQDYGGLIKAGGKVITKFSDLKVGDILEFFGDSVDSSKPSTWHNIKHTAFVGEVDKKNEIITVYDSGSRLQKKKNYKWTFSSKTTTKELHGYKGWGAIRVINLK